jgi:Family of unknown function (DUF6174)
VTFVWFEGNGPLTGLIRPAPINDTFFRCLCGQSLSVSYNRHERNVMSHEMSSAGKKRPGSHWVMVAALLVVAIAIAGALILLRVFVAERIPELTEARLQHAEELWERAGPASYVMDLVLRGAQPGVVHIEVQSGEITAMTRNGRTPPERTWRVWSVPGQFETLERELQLAEDPVHEMGAVAGTQIRVRCEFDAKYGFPRKYHRHMSAGGPEVFWQVTKFEPK